MIARSYVLYLKQFYLDSVGHASYLLGSEETGEALVIDPQRRVDGYLAAAREQGLAGWRPRS